MKKQIFSGGKTRKTNKKPKLTVFAAYGGVFALIISMISVGYQSPQQLNSSVAAANITSGTPSVTPNIPEKPSVDELIATDIVSNMAEQVNMSIASNVANLSISLAAKSELAQTSDTSIVKPQVVQPLVSNNDVITYVVQQGDTVSSIAASHGLKAETVSWANNLTGNAVAVGRKLSIPPIDGIIYTVKSSDTIDNLASTYKANKERIIAINNLELTGLKAGAKIIIPNGNLPDNQRPGYVEPVRQRTTFVNYGTGFSGGSWRIKTGTPGYSGNGYAYGNCTRYAYDRRIELGLRVGGNWGNAATWAHYAQQEGLRVDNTPSVGAIIQNGGGYGHVGIVERVLPNGDIEISEMNAYVSGGGWNIVNGRTISASQTRFYAYIH